MSSLMRGSCCFQKTLPALGLLDRTYETDPDFDPHREKSQWERFGNYVAHLNRASSKVQYKVFYITRHGKGLHNVKEDEVGRAEWEAYWSRLDGDATKEWIDARLTEQGVKQVEYLRDFWRHAFSHSQVPPPERYYTSPLTRCLETVQISFTDLDLPENRPFQPIIKETLRERFGVHTCTKRSTRASIASRYPGWEIEPGFAESDELWQPARRETEEELKNRLLSFLNDISQDHATIISLTTHSWAIRGLYEAIGHPNVWPDAGHITPLFVRVESG
ncbi:MAG: hypothetical protein Q9157_003772 [Trypethelium eluteriae]